MPCRKLMFALLILSGANACSHYHYAPNAVEIPFLTEKGASSASLLFGHYDYSGFVDVHLAYNPWRNVTAMVNYQTAAGKIASPFFGIISNSESLKYNYLEGAFGGKIMLDHTKVGLGLYAGGGAGNSINGFGSNAATDLRFQKMYVQPTIMLHGKTLQLGIGTRVSNVAFGEGAVDIAIPSHELERVTKLGNGSPYLMLETAFQVGIYFKPVTWILAVQTTKVFETELPYDIGINPNNVVLGAKLNIHDLKGRKRKATSNAVE